MGLPSACRPMAPDVTEVPTISFWVTPLSVMAMLPVGINAPRLIFPDRFVVFAPKVIAGELRLLNEGVALVITISAVPEDAL